MPTISTKPSFAGLQIYRDEEIPTNLVPDFGAISAGIQGTMIKMGPNGLPHRIQAVAYNPKTQQIEKLLIGACGYSPHWISSATLSRIWVRCGSSNAIT